MNSLSWFIYLADVLGNLRGTFLPLSIIGIAAAAGCTIGGLFFRAGHYSWTTDQDRALWESVRVKSASAAKTLWPACLISMLLLAFVPSQNTIYAIAASQVGEQVAKTEIASDATKALHQWIKKQIEPNAK